MLFVLLLSIPAIIARLVILKRPISYVYSIPIGLLLGLALLAISEAYELGILLSVRSGAATMSIMILSLGYVQSAQAKKDDETKKVFQKERSRDTQETKSPKGNDSETASVPSLQAFNIVSLKGQLSRKQFLVGIIVANLVSLVLFPAMNHQIEILVEGGESSRATSSILLLCFVSVFWYSVTLFVKRTRDAGLNTWLSLLGFIPVISIPYGIYLLFKPTVEAYGANEAESSPLVGEPINELPKTTAPRIRKPGLTIAEAFGLNPDSIHVQGFGLNAKLTHTLGLILLIVIAVTIALLVEKWNQTVDESETVPPVKSPDFVVDLNARPYEDPFGESTYTPKKPQVVKSNRPVVSNIFLKDGRPNIMSKKTDFDAAYRNPFKEDSGRSFYYCNRFVVGVELIGHVTYTVSYQMISDNKAIPMAESEVVELLNKNDVRGVAFGTWKKTGESSWRNSLGHEAVYYQGRCGLAIFKAGGMSSRNNNTIRAMFCY